MAQKMARLPAPSIKNRIRSRVRKWLNVMDLDYLPKVTFELNSVEELKKIFKWDLPGILDNENVYQYKHIYDINERPRRDAEVLATIIRNEGKSICLEIGTSLGYSAALMALNAPQAQIYTVNIPPDEAIRGEGGTYITKAWEIENIGAYYRSRGFKNINQILANTASWRPNIGVIDVAFIDGCHDTEFVINDTLKVLPSIRPGGFLVWHDYSLQWINTYWIKDICKGIDLLYYHQILKAPIYHVRDSWMGVYQVPERK